jgi:hypothetical protein
LFPGRSGNMFAFNTATRRYDTQTTLANGTGYWVLYGTPTSLTITGPVPPSPPGIAVTQAGWVLVGSRNTVLPVTSLELNNGAKICGSVFRYNSSTGRYATTPVINPGEAVWVLVDKACIILIP